MHVVKGIIEFGSTGIVIESECSLSNNLPTIVIVGLGGKAVDESKDRIRSAVASSGLQIPRKRITINLAPADIPKSTTALDLPIAVSILKSVAPKKYRIDKNSIFMGELGLDGTVRAIRGVIGKILAAQKIGFTTFYLPTGNLEQALLIPNTTIFPVHSLKELDEHLTEKRLIKQQAGSIQRQPDTPKMNGDPLAAVVGQEQAKRALTIAAAGGHNILLHGPPGTGKSMLAKIMPMLLPPLTHSEILEVTHIQSLATPSYEELATQRPFRSPHHTASHTSIVGGGSTIQPGEITLSHRGVLLLDEFPEFSRATMEALRQPLEERKVTITRVRHTVEYPADFILVATANPCPCGYYGSEQSCICTPQHIYSYQRKLSGPILDRIDIHVNVSKVDYASLIKPPDLHSADSSRLYAIADARERQQRRSGDTTVNASLDNNQLQRYLFADKAAVELLNAAAQRLNVSARAYMRVLKVARTIADLEANENVTTLHITEALQYRKNQHTIE